MQSVKIIVGNEIIFTNREDTSQTIRVKVTRLLHGKTFHDLFVHNGPERFGGKGVEWLDSQIQELYSEADQRRNGVVGIEFEIV